jgi:predicted nucleotide-binding protein
MCFLKKKNEKKNIQPKMDDYLDELIDISRRTYKVSPADSLNYWTDYRYLVLQKISSILGKISTVFVSLYGHEGPFAELIDGLGTLRTKISESIGHESAFCGYEKMFLSDSTMESIRKTCADIADFSSMAVVKINQVRQNYMPLRNDISIQNRRIFIVHGHNYSVRDEMYGFLKSKGFEPIVMENQPGEGDFLLTKFEKAAAQCGCAVVLASSDDFSLPNDESNTGGENRARQNVIFELGYFCAAISRKRVIALKEKSVVFPSDFEGVNWIELDQAGLWKQHVVQEFQSLGYNVLPEKN